MRAHRTKALTKAVKANSFLVTASVPRCFQLVFGTRLVTIPIETPKYKEMSEFLVEPDDKPFLEMDSQGNKWLLGFSKDITGSKPDNKAPFLNPVLDLQKPGMSAFKVHIGHGVYFQVQVRRTPECPTLFQLDYFEFIDVAEPVLKMVILCDIANPADPVADIIFSKDITHYDREHFKSVVATTFRDLMIYLRPWDYSTVYKHCTVTPIPKNVFPTRTTEPLEVVR